MKFVADLHIHSKYSRATAKNLDLENLYCAAQQKGITVVGTGDFTHPAWVEEIGEKLEEAEPGLFSLKKEIAAKIDESIPERCRNPVRFILQSEISNIYKKDGRVRKNHNLIYFPDMESVKAFNSRLDAIGNIKSDGRPILGLDAADLLSLMLEINDNGFFVPAHIWTPWFSLFGSKSGFDSIEECFGDLLSYIFAVETGLSSDPPMNWRVKDLDGLSLISNSDAHSPGFLGRNASVFDTGLGFDKIRQALASGDIEKYRGTLDMFPHHGKYHYDGHRNCNICLNPATTLELDGICPECGKPLTCGVLYRVQQLASRPEGYAPDGRQEYQHIIPLTDILSEIFEVGPKTKKVAGYYNKALETLGPELEILLERTPEEIESSNVPFLAEAIVKMRSGDVRIDPGYDGEFGKVNIFSREEKKLLKGEKYVLFDLPKQKSRQRRGQKSSGKIKAPAAAKFKKKAVLKNKNIDEAVANTGAGLLDSLNPEQREAVESDEQRLIIQAGPGTGKTHTLTAKIAHLISEKGVEPGSILALTFTNKAAQQLEQRIGVYVKGKDTRVLAATFHAFCMGLLKQYAGSSALIADEAQQGWLLGHAAGKSVKTGELKRIGSLISRCKQQLLSFDDDLGSVVDKEQEPEFKRICQAYEAICVQYNIMDFEDLIFRVVRLFERDTGVLDRVRAAYPYVFIDEYQDLNYGQYTLVRMLCETGKIVVIGDPDQSIYGFRGSDNVYFRRFSEDFPGSRKIELTKNYRSTQTILDASFQMITKSDENCEKTRIISHSGNIRKLIIKENATELAEAVSIVKMIEKLVGGTSSLSMDGKRNDSGEQKEYAFSDFAVLYRTARQCDTLLSVFEKEGIPCQSADKLRLLDIEGVKQLMAVCRILAKNPEGGRADEMEMALLTDIFRDRTDPGTAALDVLDKAGGCSARDLLPDIEGFLREVCRATGLSERIESDEARIAGYEKICAMARHHIDLNSFLNAVSLNQDIDTIGFDAQKVSLMSIHAAKGLEYPVVFVAGCEQGLIPFARDGRKVENLEEERRLFYVAMTRAMDILCLTYARKRRIYGSIEKRQRSFFVEDIENKLARVEKAAFKVQAPQKPKQMELFADPAS